MSTIDPVSRAVAEWMPRLVKAWRDARGIPGPADTLDDFEVHRVGAAIRRLSLGLTRGRKLVGAHYMDDADLLGAYLLYFWPVSFAQGLHALGESGVKVKSALDLGSGPGPLGLAARHLGAHELLLADRSKPALELATRLGALVRAPVGTREWNPLANAEPPGAGLGFTHVTMGHVLNELWPEAPDRIERRAALCEAALSRLRKGGALVIVEPALRETTRDLLALRDVLVRRGHVVRAPCLFRGDCPALLRDVDWCHAERAWAPPRLFGRLVNSAGLRKDLLQMAYLVVSPKGTAWPAPPEGRVFRIVSEPLEGKKRLRVMGCGPEGRVPLSLTDANRSESNDAFVPAERGDVLRLDDAQAAEEGDGFRIVPETRVRVVRRRGEPV